MATRALGLPIYRRVLREVREDDVLGHAARVAYFMFLSVPPALLVLFGLTGLFGGDELADYLTARIESALPGSPDDPGSAASFLTRFVDQVARQQAPAPLSIGIVLGIWAASGVFVALMDALNVAYDVEEDRSWVRRRSTAILVMIAFVLLFLGGSIALIAGPQIAELLEVRGLTTAAWNVLQWPLAFLFVSLAFFLVYRFLPNRGWRPRRLALLGGSAIAALLWLLATLGFRIYISNFGSYGETYGFVGAVLVLLLGRYVTGIVILVGGEINAELERGTTE